MTKMDDYADLHERMVHEQIEQRGLNRARLLEAMRAVPRHLFVPEGQRHDAYSDGALRIGQGQTISQPYIVALMSDLLRLHGDETVLEVGTGSGYQAAVLAHLAAQVHSIERHERLSKEAGQTLQALEIANIELHIGDGTLGLPQHAPYQAIVVTAAAPKVPQPLFDQLDDGGRLVLPVGPRYHQMLEVWRRRGDQLVKETIAAVAFVPLIGKEGWEDEF